jgi:ADP-heptose:LPS heptosyltransferase/GT2 family glycosyltransferase
MARQPRARSSAKPPASSIRIDIDPVVGAGHIHDRYDLLLRGRAVSATPVEEVVVRLDTELIARLEFGHDRDDGTRRVFHVSLPLRQAEAHRLCTCTIAARTRDGAWQEQSFRLSVDPSNLTPASIVCGPTAAAPTHAEARPPLVLYVERAALDDTERLLVHGWALTRDELVAVRVFHNGEPVGDARLGGRRNDVGAAFPGYANAGTSGFTLAARLMPDADNVTTLHVHALSANGFSHEAVMPVERVRALPTQPIASDPMPLPALSPTLQQPSYRLIANFRFSPELPPLLGTPIPPSAGVPPAVRDPRRDIHYFCDEMDLDADGTLSVVGWAACAIGIAAITVHVDDQEIGEAELGLPRTDVGEEYRHIPMARYSGFRLVKSLRQIAPGEHRIRMVLRNGLDDEREERRLVRIEPVPQPQTEFRLEIDTPTVHAGAVAEPVAARLTVEGWALARSGITGIEVLLDDRRLGDAHYGLARQDVGSAFPDWPGSQRSGFAFHCPPRSLRNGEHTVQLHVHAHSGDVLEHQFRILVRKAEEFDDAATIRRRITQVEAELSEDVLESIGHRPAFRILLRQLAGGEPANLRDTLASLRGQVYREWRLDVLADDTHAVNAFLVDAAPELAPKVRVIAVSDDPIGEAGEFVAFLSAGDRLGCDALLRIALAMGLHPGSDMLYADEARENPVTGGREPFFKPDFSPDLLMSTNYIGRPWFAAAGLLIRCGVTARDLTELGEYDLVLRCVEQAARVHHVPELLCLRGPRHIDSAELEAAALARAAARRGIEAEISAGAAPSTWRLRRTTPATGRVSIIIPTCAARGHIETCIKSLRECTAYRNVEIICIDNIPAHQIAWKIWLKRQADIVVPMPEPFNWSRFNNRAVEDASGEYLLFLNDDIEVTRPDWLDALLEHAQRPEVAVVGPQLLYPDNKVQHAGMFLAAPSVARHAFRFAAGDDPGYFGLALTQRNVIAVTGACMLMRRNVHEALGGFEEAHQITNNDLDFCLRAHRAGKLVVFTPYASLVHHEAASRDRLKDVFDVGRFEARWSTLFAAGDPYFNPRLSRHADDYRPDDEPAETIFAGHPLFRHADIKHILAVKVDHIGDFVTAIPAIRRLKQHFPAASIHVLASRAAKALAEYEDCIDEFIEFEFFHTVSGLGPRQISQQEYQVLNERLAAYRFDIAIDLRKHLDTRNVLRHTPARFLAGYDYMGQFPFLDIALEWEGDRHLHRKRSHVTDDLINLVDVIGTAGMAERTSLAPVRRSQGSKALPGDVRALFTRPVVAVHPGVGNVMRQWPAEHFAALIDLLVERNAVNVVLIGGAEEAELAEQVLDRVANRQAVASLVGKTSLRQLPDLLRACALYVGNNSGPKHIAAAYGVPTLGIHSGVVDAIEWGPVGRRAAAVRRNMACSPCYLARLEDCPRGFACMRGLEPASVHAVAELMLARPIEPATSELLAEPAPALAGTAKTVQAPGARPRRTRRRQVRAHA